MAVRFESLQGQLHERLALNQSGSTAEHVVVALPSYSVGESLLSHYADRIPALEHRYLAAAFMLPRIPGCDLVFLTSQHPGDDVLDYYAEVVGPEHAAAIRSRLTLVVVPDQSARSIAAKVLDDPDAIEQIRAAVAGRPAFIEPWNVTEVEVELARRLELPINGTDPTLRPLGFKGAGRRLFAEAGVPAPVGREEVRTTDDVVAAVAAIREERPGVPGVVIKHDDSGTGDGNAVIDFRKCPPGVDVEAFVRAEVDRLPRWYRDDLLRGGIVEELVSGRSFTSPSAQVDIAPDGSVVVRSTHEQLLQGEYAQVYSGCAFPAQAVYAADLAFHARAVGERLAARGAVGRFSVDFAAASDEGGRWRLYALEVNLRKGGTTHPYTTLRHLAPGRYDEDAGNWFTESGEPRFYRATDNTQDDAWVGLPPADVVGAVRDAGIAFDRAAAAGVVVHMLSCLAVDGRFGFTAIGRSREEADAMAGATREAVGALADSYS